MGCEIRQGSNPDFCPPVEEGISIDFQDEEGDILKLEFLGLVIDGTQTFGFFFPIDEDSQPLDSGEVLVLEVTSFDEDGNPLEFELVEDERTALSAYNKFQEVTKDIYKFE